MLSHPLHLKASKLLRGWILVLLKGGGDVDVVWSVGNLVPFAHISEVCFKVKDLWENEVLRVDKLTTLINLTIMSYISKMYIASSGYSWLLEVKEPRPHVDSWRWICHINALEKKVKFLVWFRLHDPLPTWLFHFWLNLAQNRICVRCHTRVEDALHCLKDFYLSR